MTTETPVRLNSRDLKRALAWAWDHCVLPLPGDPQGRRPAVVSWDDLCAACGLSSEEMSTCISRAVIAGRQSVTRELRAQRGGQP